MSIAISKIVTTEFFQSGLTLSDRRVSYNSTNQFMPGYSTSTEIIDGYCKRWTKLKKVILAVFD